MAPTEPEPFRAIALVASAGGLQAVSTILSSLARNLNAAVLVLIHQEPQRESALVEILASRSALPVVAATQGDELLPGTVVVAQPGKHLLIDARRTIAVIVSGVFPPSRPSADLLLTTLAIAFGPRAVAVVLSGGGHDGATGATAVHEFGGVVWASNEASSEVFSMPDATIRRDGVVDEIVAVDDLADRLTELVAGPLRSKPRDDALERSAEPCRTIAYETSQTKEDGAP